MVELETKADGRLYLPVEIQGKAVSGLLDSGAATSVVGRRGWAKLSDVSYLGATEWKKLQESGVKLEKSPINMIKVANGERCPVLGRLNALMEVGVFSRLESAGLTINFDKSHFCREELKYLGYVVIIRYNTSPVQL
ncbi:hypothetical protein FOCC_FOCC002220 [Frankliniella occidentalis]|nr:hypothetical protein FOCC_FOCC002220 [Frankliniella occidentalis]